LSDSGEVNIQKVEEGEEIGWSFEDPRRLRERLDAERSCLNVQIEGACWESVKNMPVDCEGVFTYVLRPSIDGISHRLICEVILKNDVKIVTLRSSLVVQNNLSIPIELAVISSDGRTLEGIYSIGEYLLKQHIIIGSESNMTKHRIPRLLCCSDYFIIP
jgi:vacuolar protein sorting-associated protein 13A/C